MELGAPDPNFFPTLPLWKFLSLAEGQTPDWRDRLRQLALEGRAYFPSPLDFNDPFDCVPHVPVPATREEIKARQHVLIRRMVGSIKSHPAEFVRSKLEEALAIADPAYLKEAVKTSILESSSKMGVFCLSESINSVLMWSHYADNHKGIAIRFDCRIEPLSGLMPLFKVRYQVDRPALGEFFSDDVEEGIADALATKAGFWEYEQEWRALKADFARKFVRFDPLVVNGIVFGVRCGEALELEIRSILCYRKIDFMRALPAEDTFALKFFTEAR